MNARGFTIIELVMVLILVGILAVNALPRFFDRNTFDSRGFHDQTLAALRYAQKSAIAQRRNVCITFTSKSVTLTIASAAGASASCDKNLDNPAGSSPFTITGRTSGVVFQTVPTNFSFNALGQPQPNSTQTVQVSGVPYKITVEKETGYVHQ